MKKIKKFKIKNYSNNTGNLIPFTISKNFPINVKRIFFIYGKKNKIRGNHAHKKCSQFFVPIFGKMVLKIKTPEIEKKINLHHSLKTGILVPPKYWCSIKFLTNNAILMVACDLNYNLNDYLNNFDKYKKYLKK